MTPLETAVIRRDGQEHPLNHLNRGDRIAYREFDTERRCYVFYVATEGIPPSADVLAAEAWDCEDRGHRFVPGNQCCMECGDTYSPEEAA